MIIVGKNTVLEAIEANHTIHELYIQENRHKDVEEVAKQHNIRFKVLTKHEISTTLPPHSQGIGAKIEEYKTMTIEEALYTKKDKMLFVMLDSITDPHNVGAIIRSADAFGVDGIIIPKRRSAKVNTTVAKVSTGAIEHVPIIEVTNLAQTMKTLKEHGFWIVGSDADSKKDASEIIVDTNLCLVIGSEGKGMRRLVKDTCDYVVKIPMQGHVNSLNASVSAAILLYQIQELRKG